MADNSNWMGDLRAIIGDIPINQLVIPGSHDSGTYEMGTGAKTQGESFPDLTKLTTAWQAKNDFAGSDYKGTVTEQLARGIRYFDIRPAASGDAYYIQHWNVSDTVIARWSDRDNVDQTYGPGQTPPILAQFRDFVRNHPNEILILKFQTYQSFGADDYDRFTTLIERYFAFDDQTVLVRTRNPDHTLRMGTRADINAMTVDSLLNAGMRVFAIYSLTDVPASIGPRVWYFSPGLELEKNNPSWVLFDPYWHDYSKDLGNDDPSTVASVWYPWHQWNIRKWGGDGLFVTQSHMEVLPSSHAPCYFYNMSAQSAGATYNVDQTDADGVYISNNTRNAETFVEWLRYGYRMNIVMADYVQYGGLCEKIIDFYRTTSPPPPSKQPPPFWNYAKCYNSSTGAWAGWLGTTDNNVIIGGREADDPVVIGAAKVRWETWYGKLYLVKETDPDRRYAGIYGDNYISWNLWDGDKLALQFDTNTGLMSQDRDPTYKMYPYGDRAAWGNDSYKSEWVRCTFIPAE